MSETDEYSENDGDFVEDNDEFQETFQHTSGKESTCPRSVVETQPFETIQPHGDVNGSVSDAAGHSENKIDSLPTSTMQSQLYETTKKLALEISKQSRELNILRREAAILRTALLQGINGGVTDSKNYEHVSLEELLRLRLQEAPSSIVSKMNAQSPHVLFRDESSIEMIQKLENKLAMETKQKDELEAKCVSLNEELRAVATQKERVENLSLQISEMSIRMRNERELKSKLSKELVAETKKVEALSDHIEKLMIHVKHEAISKSRSLAEKSRLQSELDMIKTRVEHMGKKNERKDKVISELRESGKVLEDQLHSMDEKYMELRSKLDWTRSKTSKIVKQKELELANLREKFNLIVHTSPGQLSNADLLDDFKRITMKPKRSLHKPKSIFFPDDRKVSKDKISAVALKSESGLP